MKPKIVLWDVYGTLIAAERGDLDSLVRRHDELFAAFEQTVHNFSLPMSAEALQEHFIASIKAERERRIAGGVAFPEVRIEEIWWKLLDNATLNQAREVALFFEHHANPKRFQPHAFDTLIALKQRGLRQGIVSNAQFYTPIELSELLRDESACAICTYESIFDPALVVFSFELGLAKPDLAPFRRVVEVLLRENIMPDDCVFVGDSPTNDIAPAHHLGFKTALFAPAATAELPVKPDLLIHNLAQLLEWL
jgi:putative hydrolase of the HAD superfamily